MTEKEPIMSMQMAVAMAEETLRYTHGEASLGAMLLAASGQGVVALFSGDEPAKLLRDLEEAFPGARLVSDDAGLAEAVKKAIALVDAPHLKSDLVLDLRGSPVEIAVWRALQEIPVGQTRTYGEIAKSLPVTATAQDVGAACAANRIAVAVPCHRVVKSDGSIAGYRWGVQRKRRLINKEAVW
jgi:AraC family transcriptional regulator of adaptative response/methylated-DNA-[protein]-cysteine methyltransferase